MAEQKILWHPGFYAGMELELKAYSLSFESEYQLTRGPLSIDLLIIRKLTEEKIDNEIGEIFLRHNVVEFKSPEDELSIDVFYKTQAYAALYKASGETVNAIPANEITVSLFRDVYPKEMIEQLKESGFSITQRHPGIYQIDGKVSFLTQLIVTSQLSSEQHAILRILSNHAERKDIISFLRASRAYVSSGDRERADSILQVSSSANKELYHEIYKEEPEMCEALMEIMKEDIDEKVNEGRIEGRSEGENRLGSLITKLIALGRNQDIDQAAKDPAFREKLYKEFQIA